MIYLASTSPRRRALLKKAGIAFRVLKPGYEEKRGLKARPSQIVQIHAVKKAESCAGRIKNGTLLAADTVVAFGGKIFGKPGNRREARLMLESLQGRRQAVYTGVAIFKIRGGRIVKQSVFFDKTEVRLKTLSRKGIQNYFKKVNPLDKAGAYSLQARRPGLVRKIRGSFSNAVGLPVEKVVQKLRRSFSSEVPSS